MSCNAFIPVVERNMPTMPMVVEKLRDCLCCKNIVVVAKQNLQCDIEALQCVFVDENSLYPQLTYSSVQRIISQRDEFASRRTGWYFQQFLKIMYSEITEDEEYLIWDADTIPLKRICLYDENGNPFFDVKEEYHWPYFSTMKKLFDRRIMRSGYSFISEHMLVKTEYMREMIKEITANEKLHGNNFFEKVFSAINDIDLLGSGFSEYETYGNYVMLNHPDSYRIRRLKSYRKGGLYAQNQDEIEKIISSLDQDYDILTIENR